MHLKCCWKSLKYWWRLNPEWVNSEWVLAAVFGGPGGGSGGPGGGFFLMVSVMVLPLLLLLSRNHRQDHHQDHQKPLPEPTRGLVPTKNPFKVYKNVQDEEKFRLWLPWLFLEVARPL